LNFELRLRRQICVIRAICVTFILIIIDIDDDKRIIIIVIII